MQRHLACFAELAGPDGVHARIQIDVGAIETACLAGAGTPSRNVPTAGMYRRIETAARPRSRTKYCWWSSSSIATPEPPC